MGRVEGKIDLRVIKNLEAFDENFYVAILRILWIAIVSPTHWRQNILHTGFFAINWRSSRCPRTAMTDSKGTKDNASEILR